MNVILLDITKFARPDFWIEFALSIVIIALFVFFMWRLLQRPITRIVYLGGFFLVVVAIIFDLVHFSQIVLTMLVIFSVMFIVSNIGDFRTLAGNPLKGKGGFFRGWSARDKARKVYDREEFYSQIKTAVEVFSSNKIGALITFEKHTPLDDAIKNGVPVKAPLTSELLTTIFYKGTRLHDGAVVVRDNYILAASVQYEATTKPLVGKYGSRHRAAIGISEISDSVTIVVSEETGRISIAHRGELIPCTFDNFMRLFLEYMEDAEDKEITEQ